MLSESSKSWATTVKRHLKNNDTSAGPKENDLENQKVLADSDNLHEWSQKSFGEHKTINSTNSDSDNNNNNNYYSPRSSDSNNNYVNTSNRRYSNDHQNSQKPKGHQIRLLIPEKAAGAVIGVQGKNIKRLRSEFYDDCSITLPDTDCFYERVLIINNFGERNAIDSKNMTLNCLEKVQKLISFDIEAARNTEHQIFRSNKKETHGDVSEMKILLNSEQVGKLIGEKGRNIQNIEIKNSVKIAISTKKCPNSQEQVCRIVGEKTNIIDTIGDILDFELICEPRNYAHLYFPTDALPEGNNGVYGYGNYGGYDYLIDRETGDFHQNYLEFRGEVDLNFDHGNRNNGHRRRSFNKQRSYKRRESHNFSRHDSQYGNQDESFTSEDNQPKLPDLKQLSVNEDFAEKTGQREDVAVGEEKPNETDAIYMSVHNGVTYFNQPSVPENVFPNTGLPISQTVDSGIGYGLLGGSTLDPAPLLSPSQSIQDDLIINTATYNPTIVPQYVTVSDLYGNPQPNLLPTSPSFIVHPLDTCGLETENRQKLLDYLENQMVIINDPLLPNFRAIINQSKTDVFYEKWVNGYLFSFMHLSLLAHWSKETKREVLDEIKNADLLENKTIDVCASNFDEKLVAKK